MFESNNSTQNYRSWLSEELLKRQQKNPAYSMNAFAKSLGLSAPSLSQILSGKRPLSAKAARTVIEKVKLSPNESISFLASVVREGIVGKEGLELKARKIPGACKELELDKFQTISNWYHFAILSLARLKTNKWEATWISNQLGISKVQARTAFERLERLELIAKSGDGFRRTSEHLWVRTEQGADAIRKYHRECLEKSIGALDQQGAPLEYFSSVTLAVNESKIGKVRQNIKGFRDRFCDSIEAGPQDGDRVYMLAVQFIPVSKIGVE